MRRARSTGWRFWVVVAAVAVLVGGFASGWPTRVEGYDAPLVVWQAGWGNGPGQVGWAEGKDGNRYGPRALAIGPQGKMAVLDACNRRLQVVSGPSGSTEPASSRGSAGSLARVLSLDADTYDDVVWVSDGSLRLSDSGRGRVVWLDPEGQVRAEKVTRPEEVQVYLIEGLVARADVLYLQEVGWSGTGFFRRVSFLRGEGREGGTLASLEVQTSGTRGGEGVASEGVRGLALAPDGCLYLDLQTEDAFSRRVRILTPALRPWKDVVLKATGYLGQGWLVGVDSQGCLYYVLAGQEGELGLHKFNLEGRELAVLPLPVSEFARLSKWVRVDLHGNIYYMRASQEGLVVEVHKLTRTWKWRWRGERREDAGGGKAARVRSQLQ